MGNNRGTRFGLGHISLSIESAEYWDFHQEHFGMYDVPAYIDHILQVTGQEQLTYIGHSQGSTQLFLGASLNPDYYTPKINLMVALGPIGSTHNMEVPALTKFADLWPIAELLIKEAGLFDLYDANWWTEEA